jgi:hypothetical protein
LRGQARFPLLRSVEDRWVFALPTEVIEAELRFALLPAGGASCPAIFFTSARGTCSKCVFGFCMMATLLWLIANLSGLMARTDAAFLAIEQLVKLADQFVEFGRILFLLNGQA